MPGGAQAETRGLFVVSSTLSMTNMISLNRMEVGTDDDGGKSWKNLCQRLLVQILLSFTND